MKSLLTFFAIASFSLSALSQHDLLPDVRSARSDYFVLDSFYHWGWDTTAFDWKLYDRMIYATDANQNVTSELANVKDSAQQWTNTTLITHTFNTDHQETNEVTQLWNGIEWFNNTQNVYTYDDDNNQTGILFQVWDGAVWSNSFNQVFTFDNNHHQLSRTSQHWLGTDWEDGTRQVSTYNGNNQLALRLFQNYTGIWNDVSRSVYSYDANGDLDTLLYQKWNFNDWNDDYRNVYDFDGQHNRLSILAQLALGVNVWQDRDRYDYTYDPYNHITHLIYTKHEGNEWSNIYQFNIINDKDQNRATEVFQTWEGDWVNVDSTQYYYTGITATHDFFELEPMDIFPNPARDFIFVEYPQPIDGLVSIYTLQGAKMLQFRSAREQSFLINISLLTPGVYFVALQVGNQVLTKGFQKF